MFNTELLSYLEGFLTDDRKERFLEVLSKRTTYLTVAVEDVFQFHNTSAILRSCDAFGIQEVHTIEDRFGDRLDKNIAMGAQQWVDVYRYQTTADAARPAAASRSSTQLPPDSAAARERPRGSTAAHGQQAKKEPGR